MEYLLLNTQNPVMAEIHALRAPVHLKCRLCCHNAHIISQDLVDGPTTATMESKIKMKLMSIFCLLILSVEAHFSQNAWRPAGPPGSRRSFSVARRGSLYAPLQNQVLLASSLIAEGPEDEIDYFEPDEGDVAKEIEKRVEFKDLSLGGKIVAGGWSIGRTLVQQYIGGFVFGYFLGSLRGIPHLLFKKEGLMGTPFLEEIPMRFSRWTGKAFRWGCTWGPITAAFGTMDATIVVLRNGVQDNINLYLSSAAAGAFYARAGGPVKMVMNALLYGGMTYGLTWVSANILTGPAPITEAEWLGLEEQE